MKFLILFAILISTNLFAKDYEGQTFFCHPQLGKMPILQNGRVKPLSVHAKESLKFITGKTKIRGLDAVTAYCLLSLKGLGMDFNFTIDSRVDHVKLREFLKLTKDHPYIDFEKLKDMRRDLIIEMNKIKEENSYKKALVKLLNQLGLYQSVSSGTNWMVSTVTTTNINWAPLTTFLKEEKVLAVKDKTSTPFKYLLEESGRQYLKAQGDLHILEYHYARAHLPGWALLITLLSLASLTLLKKFGLSLVLSSLTLFIQVSHMILRIIISGRAPITNMYETVMFSGLGALMLAMIIGHFKKEKTWIYMGLAYNACTLMMMNFAGTMLDDSIGPLVPVLRDNFWLSTHVTTIMLSYGALALSWILANTVIIKKTFFDLQKSDQTYYADLIYTCIKYGTTLLAAGIILGGVWADYSWGRFWGWDPKETWSLIALCIYMAILHGRYTNWIPDARFIPLIAAAFMSIMMAWFGVNYILASGLHSYGFSQGGAIFLGTFFTVQTIIIALDFKSFVKKIPS